MWVTVNGVWSASEKPRAAAFLLMEGSGKKEAEAAGQRRGQKTDGPPGEATMLRASWKRQYSSRVRLLPWVRLLGWGTIRLGVF